VLRIQIGGMANAFNMGRQLTRYSGDIRSVRPALEKAVDEVIRPGITLSFSEQREVPGVKWEKLADSTPLWPYRASRNAGNNPILDVTGKLKRVAQQKNIWTFDGQAGTAMVHGLPGAEYGRYHEFGYYNVLVGRDVPARPFMTIDQDDVEDIEQIFMDYIHGRFAEVVTDVHAVVDW